MERIVNAIIISVLAIMLSASNSFAGFGFGDPLKHGKNISKVCVKDTRNAYPIWYMGSFHKSADKNMGAVVIDQFLGKEVDAETKTQYEDQCTFLELRDGRWERDSNAKNGEYQVFYIRGGQYEMSYGSIVDRDMEPWITL